ncbi:Spy0128 family protein [Streptococcus oriscaviae]|uniref:LPXTG cell wall anchor domain-containing protein n=1 Tax=Streptococcus oriscaviae TaxID=2781599 RepID=A0ABX7YJP0_9STRE|nr:FctA domain-containing protein [Streptococcus oriscaviae]QUE53826.1 LPXTG cell wall anchor domain-containing protein [Streptococcus oriscaviae]
MTLSVLFGATAFGQTTEAKELTNVLTDIVIWDNSNGREASKESGAYALVIGNNYSFDTKFDLSAYNNNVENGDYFTFTVPAPFTVKDGVTIELTDPETKVAIADAVITSNGAGQGGTVKITMKNLQEYLAKKNATEVLNVKGSFFTSFTLEVEKALTTETFTNIKDTNTKDIAFKISQRQVTDNTEAIGKENFAKYGSVIDDVKWSSAILGKSGDYWHKWRIRSNTNGTAYSSFVVRDSILETGGPMQFIPESFVVTAGDGINQAWLLTNPVTLAPGVDYEVTFNSAYTSFELTIFNPGNRRFMIDYSTSAPADGSTVGNTVSITTDKGQMTNTIANKVTELTVTRLSRIQEGGTISIETGNRITIYKTDAETGQRLGGAVFTVTKPDGTVLTLDPTDATHGRTQSPVFTEAEIAAGKFIVKELTPPAGYVLNDTPVEVTVTANGAIRTITNKKASTSVPLAVKKDLTGRTLQADEFEFVLTDKDGKVVERVKNVQDGAVNFTALTFNQAGQYVYTITETNGGQTIDNVTYDGKTITATITVTAEPATGALSHTVDYSDGGVFNNVYVEPTTTTTTTTTEEPTTTTSETTTTTEEPSTTTPETPTPGSTTTTEPKKVLPNTGDTSNVWMTLLGLGALVLSGIGFYFHKKKA